MRVALVSIALAGCGLGTGSAFDADGSQDDSRILTLADNGLYLEAGVSGVITARGGDRADWFAVDVPRSECDARGRVILGWTPPRPGLEVQLALVRRGKAVQAQGKAGWRELEFDAAEGGRFFFEVSAPGRDDAGTYHLTIEVKPELCPEGRDLVVERPAGAQPTAEGQGVVPISAWERRDGKIYAILGAGIADGVEPGATRIDVLDESAEAVPSIQLELREVERAWSRVEVVKGPIWERLITFWTAEMTLPAATFDLPDPPPSTTPIRAAITHVDLAGTDNLVWLDRGSFDGIADGFRGELLDDAGDPIAGSSVVVTRVYKLACRALVTGATARQLEALPDVRVGPP